MKPKRRLTLWNYYLAWISVNALGWTAGFGLAQIYTRLLYANDPFVQRVLEDASYIWTRPLDSPVATANYGLMVGAAVGLTQWYVLRRRVDISLIGWLVATMAGFALHGLLLGLDTTLLGSDGPTAGGLTQGEAIRSVGVLCSGVVLVGIPQWLVLRGRVPRAGWWILASAIGLLLASPDRSGGTNSLVSWIAVTMGAGIVYGIVTAFALFFMIPDGRPKAREAPDAWPVRRQR